MKKIKYTMGLEQSVLASQDLKLPFSTCRIVVVGPKNGDDCLTALAYLPQEARILATGQNIDELRADGNIFSEVVINI